MVEVDRAVRTPLGTETVLLATEAAMMATTTTMKMSILPP
jgi:hypothetical protein